MLSLLLPTRRYIVKPLHAVLVLLVASATGQTSASEAAFLDQFSSVVHSAESGDCYGYALRLWTVKGADGTSSVIGSWTEGDGGCDNSKPIYDVAYNPDSKAISFSILAEADPSHPSRFQGKIRDDALVGKYRWGGQPPDAESDYLELRRVPPNKGLVTYAGQEQKP